MKEIWKAVPGYPDYEVSNMGRVKSIDRHTQYAACSRTKSHVKFLKGRMLKPGRNTKFGHVTVSLGRRNSINVHCLVLWAFVGPVPKGCETLHKNGKAGDNRLVNLRYGTRSDNNMDRSIMGKHPLAKLNAKKVKEAREVYARGARICDLARKYKVSDSTMSSVLKRETYSWVN